MILGLGEAVEGRERLLVGAGQVDGAAGVAGAVLGADTWVNPAWPRSVGIGDLAVVVGEHRGAGAEDGCSAALPSSPLRPPRPDRRMPAIDETLRLIVLEPPRRRRSRPAAGPHGEHLLAGLIMILVEVTDDSGYGAGPTQEPIM
jgi:hypothetical protein